jgi:predicted AAA+ superfamily ATPase
MQEPRRFIQVVMGPRQVGKTTVVTQLVQKKQLPSHFVSADAITATNTTWLEQQWEVARLKMSQAETAEFLLIGSSGLPWQDFLMLNPQNIF